MPMKMLEGGRDATEVALFSRDQLPEGSADDATLSRLQISGQALRMRTEGRGSDLLHLYIDEEVPEDIQQFCVSNDLINYKFNAMSGRIGFGSVKSTYASFSPNPAVRQDDQIEAGVYDAIACHTAYPDNFIEKKVESKIGAFGIKAIKFPAKIIGYTAMATIVLLLLSLLAAGGFLVLAILSAVAGFIWFKVYTNSANFKFESGRKRDIELNFPNLVIKMVKR
jgi:hypothetical protein